MLDKTKTDPALGWVIEEILQKNGVATPMMVMQSLSTDEYKKVQMTVHFSSILQLLGLDLNDDSLAESPRRLAKMFMNELFWGLDPSNFPKCTAVENKMAYDEMVLEKSIKVMSTCEHHFVTIAGVAHVAYIPDKKVLGLSKLNRVVEYFSRRPQIQERLTEQIYHALAYILETDNVAVVVDAEHFCVKARGVEDHGSTTITSKLGGVFKDKPEVRAEFINLIRK
jgi:GTP cyclohydrolase I